MTKIEKELIDLLEKHSIKNLCEKSNIKKKETK